MAFTPTRPRRSALPVLWTLLVASALLLASGPMAALAVRPAIPKPISVQGKLVFKDAHVRDIWTLVESGTGTVYKLPGQPLDPTRQPIATGSIVTLDCTPDADLRTRCTKVANAEISKSAAPVKSTDLELRLLVMVISLNASSRCGARPGANVDDVRDAYVGESGYASFLRNCSYGKVEYENVTVVSTLVPCSPLINACDEDAIATAAKASVIKQYGQGFISTFTRGAYILPINMSGICGWVGLAELPGSQTWFTADTDGVFNKGTVLQESLHNLNIYHGWKNGVEYDDNSTSMGMGNSCPSAPELWRLGWSSVLGLLNSANFPAKIFKSYKLPATYLGPNRNMIKIQPDWLNKYRKNLYLALRVKAGGDQDLLPEFDGKVNVHELNREIDNNFLARNDPRVSIIGTANPSSAYEIPPYRLMIKTDALLDDTISIKICRYEVSKSECNEGKH